LVNASLNASSIAFVEVCTSGKSYMGSELLRII
jgi:hypothetical protein